MVVNITEMKLGDKVNTNEAMPGMSEMMGENMTLVGVTYHLLGDSNNLQQVSGYAKWFNPKDYED